MNLRNIALALLSRLRQQGFRSRVSAQVSTLPVLRRQLQETAGQIESAVVNVCGDFERIATRAQEAIGRASSFLRQDNGAGAPASGNVEKLIGDFRTIIERLLSRMEHSNEVSQRTVERMHEVELAANRVLKALGGVDRIAFQNRLLALNAKVQSVHLGEEGNAFGVVADEIAAQAVRGRELADEITGIIDTLHESVRMAVADLLALLASDAERLADSRREAETALAGIETTQAGLQRGIADISSDTEELTRHIRSAVVSLQFQDRTSQRIGHVIETLAAMERVLGGGSAEGGEAVESDAVAAMARRYTMESERAALTGETAGKAQEQDGTVEFF